MKPDASQWSEVSAILDQAFDLPATQRRAFAEAECAGRPKLLRQVLTLLEADQADDGFLNACAAEHAAGLILGNSENEHASLRFGVFQTTRLLGTGGMGVVYEAQRDDGEFEQTVAIKCMRGLAPSAELQRRFVAERQILAQLNHPGIAHILDGGVTDEGHPYFAMEFVDGIALTEYCDAHRLTVDQRIALFLDVCAAVSHAHRNLVVHRDLKPSNILIVNDLALTDPAQAQIKLLDFGIARLMSTADSADAIEQIDDEVLLTPEYAAPEQLLRAQITTLTDVYALGLLLYELLSGTRAQTLQSRSTQALQTAICTQVPALPSVAAGRSAANTATESSQRARRLRGDLDAIVMKAIEKDPRQRYGSVESLAADLRRHRALEPVRARAASVPYRCMRFIQRYRWGVAGTLAIVLLLIGLTALSVRSNRQVRSALAEARVETAKAREIADFLHQLFELADPYAEQGQSMSISELLDQGAARITRDLAQQPQTQSGLLFELARIYNSLGDYPRADQLFEQALAIQRQLTDSSNARTAQILHWQSIVADHLGQYSRSQELAVQALKLRRQTLGENHPDTAESMDRMASLSAYSGESDDAITMARQAVQILTAAVGESDSRTQTATHNLAWMLGTVGRYEQALPLYEKLIATATLTSGAEHPNTLETKNNFAAMLRHQGSLQRAEGIYREVLAASIRQLGEDHPRVGYTQNNLARVLQDKGQLAEASSLFGKSLAILRKRYGDAHSNVAISLSNLAQVQLLQGQLAQAETAFRQSLAIHLTATPEGNVKVARTQLGLGQLLIQKRAFIEAEGLLQSAYATLRKALDDDNWQLAEAQLRLGQLASARGDRHAARALLESSLVLLEGHFDADHSLVRQARAAVQRNAQLQAD